MAQIFETSEDIAKIVNDEFVKTGLQSLGVNLKVLSTTKSKDIFKLSKTSPTTAFLTKKDLQLVIYERAFDLLAEDMKERLIEMVLSNVSFDSEKDKLIVDTNPFNQIFNMRRKYGETILNDLESGYLAIKQIEDDEKELKERQKEEKKQNRRNNQDMLYI